MWTDSSNVSRSFLCSWQSQKSTGVLALKNWEKSHGQNGEAVNCYEGDHWSITKLYGEENWEENLAKKSRPKRGGLRNCDHCSLTKECNNDRTRIGKMGTTTTITSSTIEETQKLGTTTTITASTMPRCAVTHGGAVPGDLVVHLGHKLVLHSSHR